MGHGKQGGTAGADPASSLHRARSGHGRHRSARAGGTQRPRAGRPRATSSSTRASPCSGALRPSRSPCAASRRSSRASAAPRGAALNGVRKRLEAEHAARAEALVGRRAGAAPARGRGRRDAARRRPFRAASPHLLSQTQRAIEDVFVGLGYRIAEGPEVELEYYNFTALNTPDDHPAKAESDTLWVAPGVVLRTQTSPVQVADDGAAAAARVRDRARPGLPPRRARRDALAACSSRSRASPSTAGLTLGDLKGTLEHFARALFGADREMPHALRTSSRSPSRACELDVSRASCATARGCRAVQGARAGSRSSAPAWSTRTSSASCRLRPRGRGRASRSAWASSASRCSSTASRTCARFYDNDLRFLEQFAGGRAMKVPLQWLPDHLADRCRRSTSSRAQLSLAGVKVEGIERRGAARRGRHRRLIVAGLVLEAGKHPNADRLQLCQVDVGERRAAPDRVRRLELRRRRHRGRRAAGHGACPTAATLARAKLRGETSDGMILSERELELSDEHERDHRARRRLAPGEPLASRVPLERRRARARGHLEPRRPALGARRRARRRDAVFDLRLRRSTTASRARRRPADDRLDPGRDRGRRRSARASRPRVSQDVDVGPSPLWLKARV